MDAWPGGLAPGLSRIVSGDRSLLHPAPIPELAQAGVVAGAFRGTAPEDEVVEDLDLEQVAGPDQVPGHADVGLGGAGVPGGMVVGEDDGVRAGHDGGAEDLSGMDEDLVQESLGDGLDAQEAAAGVDEEHLEAFDGRGDGVVAQEGGDGLGMVEDRGFLASFLGEALGEREGGLEGEGLVAADAGAAQVFPGGPGDGLEAAKALEQGFCDGEGGGSTDAGAEEDGDELGGAQGVGATLGEAFAGTVGEVKVVNALGGRYLWRGLHGRADVGGRRRGVKGWEGLQGDGCAWDGFC